MIGKKINQLATELAPDSTDLTIIGDPISGVSKKITLAQLGAIFSGAVAFYTNLAAFPVTGDINVIYCAKDTQKLYLWSGSAYVEVFPSQALLNTYQLRSEKGVSNGYASLDAAGKVPISQLPSSIMEYKGTWNASTNTPTLANGTGDTGDVYICNVAGTVNFGAGPITFAIGDYVIYSGTIWQRSSGAVGTVTSVAASITGDAIGITGSPVTTSGTLALAFAGTSSQYINGAGNLTTFPTLTGYVPYTGATANVDLGTFDLTADIVNANDIKALSSAGLDIYSNSGTHIALFGAGGGAGVTFYGGIVGTTGSFTSNGGSDTFAITHSSGSGIALNITKGGNGEGLYINKTSGSGNAATIIGTLNATTLVKSGGTSSQFLKADGSVDSTSYQPILTNPVTGTGASGQVTYFNGTSTVTGTNNHFWDATNNRLGIGTTTPQRSIEIFNSTADNHLRLSGNAPSVSMGEAVTGSIYQAKFGLVTVNGQFVTAGVAGDFVIISQTGATIIGTSSTEKMRVQSSGNVSINNTNDTYKLDVTGTGRFTGQLRLESTITDGTYTYTLPSATGTLALTSALSGYLPLTGGTLTGALAGTSATFSGNLGLGVTPNSSTDPILESRYGLFMGRDETNLLQNAYFNSGWKYAQAGFANRLYLNGYTGGHEFYTATTGATGGTITWGTPKLTIASTGAATFSSSVAVSELFVNAGAPRITFTASAYSGAYRSYLGTRSGAEGILQLGNNSDNFIVAGNTGTGGNLKFYVNATSDFIAGTNGTLALTLASTGAATFSSSVTAGTQFIGSNTITDPTVGITTATVYALNGPSSNNTFGIGIGAIRNSAYDMWFQTGAVNGGGYRWYIGTSEKMTMSSTGNVGIGTTSPGTQLETTNAPASDVIPTTGLGGSTTTAFLTQGSLQKYGLIIGTLYTSGAVWLQSKYRDITASLPLSLQPLGGNVGIGTTTPGSKLSIVGLPTSSSGLTSGDIWNDSGTLKIV